MATVTVKRSDVFPIGTSVAAYPAEAEHPGIPAPGSSVETETVDAAGALALTALEPDTPYVLYASVSGERRYLRVQDSTFTAPGTLKERIEAKRTAVGA